MNNLARTLLLVGAIVLALLIGVLIGRGQRSVEPTEGNAQSVQITTAPPPMAAPTPLPAPAPPPPEAPKAAAIPKIAPDLQVQEDAAAVGMTTREGADQGGGNQPAAKSAAGQDQGGDVQPPG